MWTRDHYFPATYAQATWKRLESFFHLPGRIVWGRDTVQVELRPFNDRRLTLDLAGLCQRVEAAQPRLPDGRRLVLREASVCCLDFRRAAEAGGLKEPLDTFRIFLVCSIRMNIHPNRTGRNPMTSQEKREAILQAALELIAERGLHDTPMSLIAQHAGASAGTIYHHFADKDDLIHAIYRSVKIAFNRALLAGNVAALPHEQAFRQMWLNAYHFYQTHQMEAQFLDQYENSPYYHPHLPTEAEQQAEEYLPELARLTLDHSGQPLTKTFPPDVLYELTIGVAVRLAKHRRAGLPPLDEQTLETIAATCYQAVMR